MIDAIDLFAGCGGMSLGMQRAGFDVLGVELDSDAAATHRRFVGPCEQADVTSWTPIHNARFVAGGVPCQPFSTAGSFRGTGDIRGSLFRHLIRVATASNAEAVLLENVRGLYAWKDPVSKTRLLSVIESAMTEAGFTTQSALLNASGYGVPQSRVRLFVVGLRSQAAVRAFQWPEATHGSHDSALASVTTLADALGVSAVHGLDLAKPSPTVMGNRQDMPFGDRGLRDRIRAQVCLARGVPNRVGAVRITPRECALLQGFDDGFVPVGNHSSVCLQIANAVPPPLAQAVATSVRKAIDA